MISPVKYLVLLALGPTLVVAGTPATCHASVVSVLDFVTAVIEAKCDKPITRINLWRNGASLLGGKTLDPPADTVQFVIEIIPGQNSFTIHGEGGTVLQGNQAMIIKGI